MPGRVARHSKQHRSCCLLGGSARPWYYGCFRHLSTLAAYHDVWKPESRRQFRSRMLIEMGPLFRLEAVPKMKTENFRPTNHQFRVFKAISYGTALRTAKSRFFPASKNRRTEVGLQTYHDPSFSECFQTATFHKYWYSTAVSYTHLTLPTKA